MATLLLLPLGFARCGERPSGGGAKSLETIVVRTTGEQLMSRRTSAITFLTLAALATAAGGCAGDTLQSIDDEAQFQNIVIQSRQPVLVEFYKGG